MTTTERPTVSPIVCTPWCYDGGGHTDAVFAEDQTCLGEWHFTPAEAVDGHPGQVAVLAYRGNGKQPDVAVNVEVANVCEDLHFTPAHARQFAESLLAVADELERVGDK